MTGPAHPYLRFGLGEDWVARAALLASLLALLGLCRPRWLARLERVPAAGLLLLFSCAAAALSWGYVSHFLRGGPRIVDAAHYFLQARAFAEGGFGFSVPEPLAAFHGRFLLATAEGSLGVLFPPGYSAALALAFLLGSPMAFGPLLAAALVVATYFAAREFGANERVALGAALLGVLSAALRYHTADTMSHGWSALLLTVALTAAARGSGPAAALAGACTGWLVASRPVTGAVALVFVVWLLRQRLRQMSWLVPGLLPGGLLLLLHQRALTGSWFESTQLAYYALADGPPGCFRYGFGANIGCWFEHGEFVRAHLADGYGLGAALANSARRLAVHAADITNFAPLVLAVPLALRLKARGPGPRSLVAVVVAVMAAYAPFYFEGSYPGGGARLFADVLPLEHVLVAQTLSAVHLLRFAWPLSLAGFALHTSHQHRLLAEREGGRPMFEASVLARQGIASGLVFVSTDHGFALGHDPSAAAPLIVARLRGDSLDRLLWDNLGRPPAYRYDYATVAPSSRPRLLPWSPPAPEPLRIEGESLWPPLGLTGGWVHPQFNGAGCVSGGRTLRVRADHGSVEARLAVPSLTGAQRVLLGWVGRAGSPVWVRWSRSQAWLPVRWDPSSSPCERSQAVGPMRSEPSEAARPTEVELGDPTASQQLEVRATSGELDYVELLPPKRKGVDN
ncbi:MAG TPA: hypothetical protein VER33_00170 [Polyangiaceae bacterium]|nr:hypothetical protein [Polyangiaceae bacterium]